MTTCSLIFDIKRYAINDGPGIRTTIFFKGCPLRCVWCHNSESWQPQRQLLYKAGRCIGCATCVEICRQGALTLGANGLQRDKNRCLVCGRCADECPTTALEICGKEWTMDSLMAEVEKERDVMTDSGGGVTLCGGEPLMHHHSTMAILKELGRRGFHRVVDTSLYAPTEVVQEVASECELMLVDIKLMDNEKHRLLTGVSNELILDNIRWLDRHQCHFAVRIPLIEGINADDDNMRQTAHFLDTLSWAGEVYLLPYHDVGRDKHRRMWSTYNPKQIPMAAPSDELLRHCAELLGGKGRRVIEG